ncbi:CDGSH-type Zn-finger protein [Nocardioides thalensis]|uniref:CDGSH-type Zn-finger protein n=1 Tax=Nocardioides thalensis TaxID=1914755 RepID=A0A853C658_9ACTN|nr:CDGSH iron-sulfur domain-containing protein [Nocardioides thalensis]NYJ03550.1 CDGSH-type Zn-finger protein [Nocardioides thalensis]
MSTPLPRPAGDAADLATVTPLDDGPLQVEGAFRVVDPDGTTHDLGDRPSAYLCRCGASARKPFCDGSHLRVGFRTAAEPGQ